MTVLFQSKTILNRSTCRAFLALTWHKNSGFIRWLLWAASLIAIAYGVLQLMFSGTESFYYPVFLFIMAGFAFFLANWGYLFRVKPYTEKQQKLWRADTLEVEVLFLKEYIIHKTKYGEQEFYYNRINKLLSNKQVYILLMGSDAIMIQKDSFVQGDIATFRPFIKKKIKENKNRK